MTEPPNAEAFKVLGQTLSLAVYTNDQRLMELAYRSNVNLVSINKGTSELDRTQPHEGSLFNMTHIRRSSVV